MQNDLADDNGPAMEVELLETLEMDDEVLPIEDLADRKRMQFMDMFNEIAAIAVPSPCGASIETTTAVGSLCLVNSITVKCSAQNCYGLPTSMCWTYERMAYISQRLTLTN